MDIISDKDSLFRSAGDTNPEVRWKTANNVRSNFKNIEKDLREKLLKKFLTDSHPGVRMRAVEIVSENFLVLDEKLRNEILENAINDSYFNVRKKAVELIDNNFANISPDVFKKILEKFEHDESSFVRAALVRLIDNNFKGIGAENAGQLLQKFFDDYNLDVKIALSELVVNHFDEFKNAKALARKLISGEHPQIIKKLIKIKDKIPCDLQKNFNEPKPKKTKQKVISKGKPEELEIQQIIDIPVKLIDIIKNSGVSSDVKKELISLVKENVKIGNLISNALNSQTPLIDVLKNLSEHDDFSVRICAVNLISKNFYVIPQDIRESLLKRLANDSEPGVRKNAAECIVKNFSDASITLQEELFRMLTEDNDESVIEYVYGIINRNFNKILKDINEELLLNLMQDIKAGNSLHAPDNAKRYILSLINLKFNDVSEEKRHEIIKTLAGGDSYSKSVAANIVSENFESISKKIREEILNKLIEDGDENVKKHAIDALCLNFDGIKSNIISEKLFESWLSHLTKSADANDCIKAAHAIAKNWNIVPDEFKDEFKKLAEDKSPSVRHNVVTAMTKNFNTLIINTQNEIIQKLAQDTDNVTRANTALLIAKNYKNVSHETQEFLSFLSEDKDPDVRSSTANAIATCYNNLPWEVCEKLKVLAMDNNPSVRKELGTALGWNRKNLPKPLIKEFPEEIQKIAERSNTEEESEDSKTKLKFQKMKIRLFRR